MNHYVIANARIYTEYKTIHHGYIEIAQGTIKRIAEGDYNGDLEVVDAKGHHVLPGFIDIHIHGGYGHDAMDADAAGLKHLSQQLLSEGTTSYLPTTMTQSFDAIEKALTAIASYHEQAPVDHAEILGVHLEGPFISEHKVGAQNPKFVRRPSVNDLEHLYDVSKQMIKIVTIAPEVEGAIETIEHLSDRIIFSLGHSVATFEETNTAIAKGARHITHLYNAGQGFNHRAPGLFGASWTNPLAHTELIVDGVHSHPEAVNIAYQMKTNRRFYLITDAMRAKGMPDGEYDLGGQNVIVKNNEARLESGSLAGSILKMNEGLANLMRFTHASLEDLWRVTSYNQAKALNIHHQKGSIEVGKDADLVILDDEINVLKTIKNGYIAYNK
ncbi:N-acetylglucosamine-6-phosphate deacetylase [Staphylococcus massiliensis]|uniref:N-acetylglucosamine-6-phosphate deacetylase n=1 Tax=Staphylococcus massiliensis TaxID=555791 RepID=UPI001EDFD37F|nr:N-acetylglucosamine-6-phosphate deacetylase [Staphylococcus massiliensis]MCG3400745.1 N-acetylglucosamine-6-phosphate deacetylase [Staphylococcus massiliensis]